jgi:energy-coupling factor transport system substrate-specific component
VKWVKTNLLFHPRSVVMAALAALGGVVSTYVNAVGDLFQSALGFAGSMQWAAGLHVLWLTLAVGLTRKQGAGTVTGLLKGGVELLTGNTHGLLVVLVDIVAGLLVDLGFLPFRNKESLPAYCLAGGLGAASNVFVFQLFASLPAELLTYGAMLVVGGVAFLSGVLFAGILARGLVNTLRRAGVVKDSPPVPMGRKAYPIFFGAAVLLAVVLALFLRQALRGPTIVQVSGAVAAPYPGIHCSKAICPISAEARQQRHRPLRRRADSRASRPRPAPGRRRPGPDPRFDGYAFFQHDEARKRLLLASQGKGDGFHNVVGAKNNKAGCAGSEMSGQRRRAEVSGALEQPSAWPNDWQFDRTARRSTASRRNTRRAMG